VDQTVAMGLAPKQQASLQNFICIAVANEGIRIKQTESVDFGAAIQWRCSSFSHPETRSRKNSRMGNQVRFGGGAPAAMKRPRPRGRVRPVNLSGKITQWDALMRNPSYGEISNEFFQIRFRLQWILISSALRGQFVFNSPAYKEARLSARLRVPPSFSLVVVFLVFVLAFVPILTLIVIPVFIFVFGFVFFVMRSIIIIRMAACLCLVH
jgi:hypothetical protein